jgi:putative ABC transport system substrate-binding protein
MNTPFSHDGGLMAYGPNLDAIYDRADGLADQILKGANPADLPLELPTALETNRFGYPIAHLDER